MTMISRRTRDDEWNLTYADYIKYTTRLLIGFGVMFEFPLAVFFLAKAGMMKLGTD